MAQDIQVFTCTFQPGGAPTALTRFELSMPARTVRGVEFMIAYGNRGAVNFALGLAGQPIIPSNPGAFITGDDETIHWDLAGYPDSGAWQLFGYNLGTFPHTIQVRFLLDLPAHGAAAAVLQPLSLAGLSAA